MRIGIRVGPWLRRRRDERGASGVEFLIMAAVLIGLFSILVQFGINLYGQRVAQAAAREGAVAAARFDGTEGAGARTAKEYLTQDGAPAVTGSRVSVSRSSSQAAVTVRVEVVSIMPWLDDPISSTAIVRVERFVE